MMPIPRFRNEWFRFHATPRFVPRSKKDQPTEMLETALAPAQRINLPPFFHDIRNWAEEQSNIYEKISYGG
ncbi:hypothetical protein CEXT_71291 [Caerostris extrusa]|uniref:Uncharacterized protein n=1 Tax=Caerostris extrusa TaxID=172846 RepID=A0AAV4U510_CAEEX|nr:hypothetical protein CEXT_71291 [Caerostris extrusa]